MQSFRTEIENPIVEKDVIDLEKKIRQFKEGTIDEESFRSLRLARGVYGQRQQGVQMVRIKLPLGIISPKQLIKIAELSDEYADGNLHLTTRQDIQIHHVSLDHTPELWAKLEQDDITLREACGNTVRNITASHFAGIDVEEPFDVTPYAWSLFEFFLRNPIQEEMGRKFKISFSSSEKDRAKAFMHDLGFLPKIENGKAGFKVKLGGGLGAQPFLAETIKEFLPVEDLIRFAEAVVKVFDKYGERTKRNKARFKFLLQTEGVEFIKEQIDYEFQLSQVASNYKPKNFALKPDLNVANQIQIDQEDFDAWRKSNVHFQKQAGYYAIELKVLNGNLDSQRARKLAKVIANYAHEHARLTIGQNLLIRSVEGQYLPFLYQELKALNLVDNGASSIADITACPGTITCNLGITATYPAAEVIEQFIRDDFPQLLNRNDLKIKMSGCMNSCGQHAIASIGFHGSTIKKNGLTFPAFQLLLGGATLQDGEAQFADKVLKFPSKRITQLLTILLSDIQENNSDGKPFYEYYNTQGKNYFYDLLKEVAEVSDYQDDELLDWGTSEKFFPQIGVGECAGVKIDLVKTLLYEAYDKIEQANYFIELEQFNDAKYVAYSSIIQSAKAYLVKKGLKTNSKKQIQQAFEEFYPQLSKRFLAETFAELLNEETLNINSSEAREYVAVAQQFHLAIDELNALENENE